MLLWAVELKSSAGRLLLLYAVELTSSAGQPGLLCAVELFLSALLYAVELKSPVVCCGAYAVC